MFNYISDDSVLKPKDISDGEKEVGHNNSDNKNNLLQGTPSVLEFNPPVSNLLKNTQQENQPKNKSVQEQNDGNKIEKKRSKTQEIGK